MDANGIWYGLMRKGSDLPPAKVLVIGAGSRGNAYSRVITANTKAIVAAVAEPIEFKRNELGKKYIWHDREPEPHQAFSSWKQFLQYEIVRRKRADAGEKAEKGVDAVLVCTLDEQHAEILIALAPFNLHVLCEKPLATTLQDCLHIYSSLLPTGSDKDAKAIFGIGHVLRYSPHNILLRQLLLHERIIGDVISVEHTEPVGWWHFTHSYVRGNWRKESDSAATLMTKSCHDIDFLLWILCSPPLPTSSEAPHLPSKITSIGSLNYFRKSRKPKSAGNATNCLSCPIEESCRYSAKNIYVRHHLCRGNASWPVKIVCPDIEDCLRTQGPVRTLDKLLNTLAEDYSGEVTSPSRPYFGRCVYEADNDVCDDQFVSLSWDDDTNEIESEATHNRHAKTATFHMIAHTDSVCQRRGRIYGSHGEIVYDSNTILVHKFGAMSPGKVFHPEPAGGGHGGGDDGLITQFIQAVDDVRYGKMRVADAQLKYIGCGLEEIIRSHAMVFAAEDARRQSKVVNWKDWWGREVESKLKELRRLDNEYEIVNA